MIAFLQGTVKCYLSAPPRIIVLTGGVGYEVLLPTFVSHQLADSGIAEEDDVALEIYHHVTERQPRPMLVGFLNRAQKEFFEQIIEVEGIGPMSAVTALVLQPQEIVAAIETKDVGLLTQMPGIGKRAAEKIIASLHGKIKFGGVPLAVAAGTVPSSATNAQNEAIQALVILKVNITEARRLVEEVARANPAIADSTESIIREVFRAQQNRGENSEVT